MPATMTLRLFTGSNVHTPPDRRRVQPGGRQASPVFTASVLVDGREMAIPGGRASPKNRHWCGAAWTPHQWAFVPLLRGVLQYRLLRCLQHRGGFLGDGRALEETWVLRAPQPHRIGEDEVAEIVVRQNPVLDQLIGFRQ